MAQGQPAAANVCAAQKSYTGFVADFSQVSLSAASPRPPIDNPATSQATGGYRRADRALVAPCTTISRTFSSFTSEI
jgi:hypothetical protein